MPDALDVNLLSHTRTLLGSYRPEIEEVGDIPEIAKSFGGDAVQLIEKELDHLLRVNLITKQTLERFTGHELESDNAARRFIAEFCTFLRGETVKPPQIEDF